MSSAPIPSFSSMDEARAFAAMVEKVRDYAIFLTDADGTIQTWNPAAEHMKGYRAEEAIGSFIGMLYTEEEQRSGAPRRNLQEAAEKGTYQEEAWRRKKDGSLFWALVELIAIRDADARLIGFCKVTRDLTDHKQLVDQIASEKERAQVTLGAIADGVISLRADGTIDFMNAKAEGLTGWSVREAADQALGEVFRIEENEASAVQVAVDPRTAAAQGAVLVTRDGARRPIEYAATAIRGPDGRDVGTVVVLRDVAQRRAVETERQTADRRKDEFLAMLAHELRNPLAALSAATDLLGTGKLDAAGVGRAAAVLARQIRHMSGLIDDLLDVSRVTRGLVALEKAPLDLTSVITQAVEQARPLIEKRRHALTLELDSRTATVLGDHKRLVQVISNVLGNAAKYTNPGGQIRLKLDVLPEAVSINVADNGIGMSAELLTRAFQMFAQAEPSSDRAQGGLGIGLALVKSLVEMHGGTVTIQSEGERKGSAVQVTLPRWTADPEVTLPSVPAPSRWPMESSHTILVVDDNEDAAYLIGEFLRLSGYEVLVEHEAGQGLAQARAHRPSACLLDVGLPDFDGYELARRLREQPETKGALLMAITGFGQPQDVAKAHAAGFDHHFVKPVDKEKLIAALHQALDKPM